MNDGAQSTAPGSRTSKARRVARVLAVAVLGAAATALGACGGGDGPKDVEGGLDFVEPAELSDNAREDLRAALDALPRATGLSDADKTHSLLGAPDVFQLWFEVKEDGRVRRSETWYYLDLEVSYEFLDGTLLFTVPVDEIGELVLVPLRYDPLAFDPTTTLDDIREMLDDPDALTPEDIREEYELDVTVWAGEQILAAFDADGALLYVETVALELAGMP